MSDKQSRALEGPVVVIAKSPSFAELYAARFGMPDQVYMKQIMRATAAGLAWDEPEECIAKAERNMPFIEPFKVFELADYDQIDGHVMGAPVPPRVRKHINQVKAQFPGVSVRIHAHPFDDPVVEYAMAGESVFGKAWLRRGDKVVAIYPSLLQDSVRKLRFW